VRATARQADHFGTAPLAQIAGGCCVGSLWNKRVLGALPHWRSGVSYFLGNGRSAPG